MVKIMGKVLGRGGEPVENATVVIGGLNWALTDSGGIFEMDAPPGTSPIQVVQRYYKKWSSTVTILAEATVIDPIVLTRE